MAEPLRPASRNVFGKENWIFVPTIADITAPTVAEVTAASALDITNIAFASAGPTPSQSTSLATAERRVGDTKARQRIGQTTYAGGEMTYQFDPQGAAASDVVKAWETFGSEGTTGFLVRRQGIAKATTPAAGQFVDVYPVEFGPSMPTSIGQQDSEETAAVCTFAITDVQNGPVFKKAIAA